MRNFFTIFAPLALVILGAGISEVQAQPLAPNLFASSNDACANAAAKRPQSSTSFTPYDVKNYRGDRRWKVSQD